MRSKQFSLVECSVNTNSNTNRQHLMYYKQVCMQDYMPLKLSVIHAFHKSLAAGHEG